MMSAATERLGELAKTFELVAEATEQLLGEYALFVLEHEEVVGFLQAHLTRLKRDFKYALDCANYRRAKRTLDALQLLFGEAQLEVNRSVLPLYEQVSQPALSKTNF